MRGKDFQSFAELQNVLQNIDISNRPEENLYISGDGNVWKFSTENITLDNGDVYTQVTAANVTELYHRQQELLEDNRKLEEYAERMRRLSSNIITLIREEEILNMKMRVHDDVGRSVIATRRLLWQHKSTKELNLDTWKTAIRLLKHDNEYREDKVTVERLSFSASCMGIRIITTGELPMDTKVAELIITAIRECMTNAVRHAGATRLYVNLSCTDDMAYAVITNDGAIPQGKITEGGGLSSLRARIRNGGGTMEILSEPEFELKVAVPCKKTDEYSGRRI